MADSPRIDELRRRVQMDPASIAFAALAEEYRRSGRYEEAIATCAAGLQRHPAYLSAHVTLGRSLIETGQYDEAREELEHVLRLAPENLAAIRGLADIQQRRGDLPESAKHSSPSAGPAPATPAPPHPTITAAPPAAPVSAPSIGLSSAAVVVGQSVYGAVAPPAAVPRLDRAVERLEGFLALIVRARHNRPSASR